MSVDRPPGDENEEVESWGNYNELDFLMDRLDQIGGGQSHTNEIIHRTFYISVVVFGVVLGAIPQLEIPLARRGLYVFSAFIFLAMFGWSRTYLNSRRVLEKMEAEVVSQLGEIDAEFTNIKPVKEYFTEPTDFRQDKWEQNWRKEILIEVYYIGLALLSILILLIDVGLIQF